MPRLIQSHLLYKYFFIPLHSFPSLSSLPKINIASSQTLCSPPLIQQPFLVRKESAHFLDQLFGQKLVPNTPIFINCTYHSSESSLHCEPEKIIKKRDLRMERPIQWNRFILTYIIHCKYHTNIL